MPMSVPNLAPRPATPALPQWTFGALAPPVPLPPDSSDQVMGDTAAFGRAVGNFLQRTGPGIADFVQMPGHGLNAQLATQFRSRSRLFAEWNDGRSISARARGMIFGKQRPIGAQARR
jgi:hypothetical protein